MPDRALGPGDVVAGKYRVERVLGEGGMGYVLGARNITLDEPVAIKILKPDAVASGDAVARFFREARAAVRMKGEHVAKVLDVGALDDGTPYMLMELLEGADLSAVVERSGGLPIATAVDYVLQTCEALAEAHALGIVHRDIKPSNLFLTTGVDGLPSVKVLDFGISKATNAIDATRPDFGLTETQTVMGSPQYMAPEQMRSSRRVDGRTDIWGLGTILHELLTGEPPFVASSMPELFAMILQDPAPSLRTRRNDVPPELDAVVLKCLEKSPDARPATVLELARMLAPFASALSAGAASRVERVGRNVADASERNIAMRESSPDFGLATPQALPVPVGGAVPGSAPELAHAHTMRMAPPTVLEPRRNRTALIVVAAALGTLVIGGGTAFAVITARERHVASVMTTGAAEAASTTAATNEAPPPATSEAPPAPALDPAASAASAASTSSATTAGSAGKRPPLRPLGRGSASARPANSAAPVAEPPRPAATASSRYD
ncbi:MAG: Serine/threonine protein kinase PrkC, regulator of stationary phase [Labilithrix sp.]|nr:Serine/threonine protein kinase PrkC, regulator of stationary phase [Labilithrix sp.]